MSESAPLDDQASRDSLREKERTHMIALLEKAGKSATAAFIHSLDDTQYRALDIACARLTYGTSSIADSRLDDVALLDMIKPFATPEVDTYVVSFRKAIEATLDE